jgi:hypothetical protein
MRTLAEKYALAWLDTSTITLFTLIGSLLYLLSSISHHMAHSRSRLETVCDAMNTTSEQIYHAPTLLLEASLVSMVTAKENIHRNLSTAVTVLESCVVWLILLYKSTYRCLLGLAIRAVLSLVTQIAGPVQHIAESITSLLHLDASVVGKDWVQSIQSTQTQIDQWFDNGEQWLNTPFQALQTQLNNTFNAWQPSLFQNTSILQQQQHQYFCDSTPLIAAITEAEKQLKWFIWIVIGFLFGILFVCVLIHLVCIRFRHYRVARARSLYLRTTTEKDRDMLLDKYIWSTTTLMSWRKRNQPLHQLLCFLNHPVALYCLLVGISGLVMIYGLVWLLQTKSHQIYTELAAQMQQWTENATFQWTRATTNQFDEMNHWIQATELDLNNHAFGIIRDSAITINDTLTNVVSQVQDLIQTVLGGTLLETPAKELTECLLLTKVENIEQGLTWIVSTSHTDIYIYILT